MNGDSTPDVHKKHKKHKKKHKRRHAEIDDGYKVVPESSADIGGSPKGPLKLKLKLGAKTVATKSVVTVQPEITETYVNVIDEPWKDDADPTIITKNKGDDTSDEEREWLSALEKGELDDYGELSKKKDPNLMTARQRALKHGTQEEELMQLPTGYKSVELTDEQLQRRQQRANKRRQLAHEKREKDKKHTLERLLKKQEGRKSKARGAKKADVPKLRYTDSHAGINISVPHGYQFPFVTQPSRPGPKSQPKCAVKGCSNEKKYSCSKTGQPLCSLACYKKNLINHKLPLKGMVT